MIVIRKDENDNENEKMIVHVKGNAEDIANEYAALTFWLMNKHSHIYDRALNALEHHIKML